MTSDNANLGRIDADLPAGMKVGEYIIAEQIGVGGFGSVYRAEHPLIGKQVAIKVLGQKLSADPEMVSRFIAEARSVNQIQSKYIIDIFGFGELEDGRQYYIMELLDGMPLDEYLDELGCVPLSESLLILRGIGKALDAAHKNGVAHRDLKPENVYLVKNDLGGYQPVLLDFGIAKLLGEEETLHKTRTGAPIGTPLYMSPEQCRGRGVDHRTDIYAFGCMTYRMLTGQVPFDGEGYTDILFKQIQEEPTAPTQVNPALPPGVDSVIAAMMAKIPDDRPPTLGACVKALEASAYAGGVTVPGTSSAAFTPLPETKTPRPRSFEFDAAGSARTVAATNVVIDPVRGGAKKKRAVWITLIGLLALAAGVVAFLILTSGSENSASNAKRTDPRAISERTKEIQKNKRNEQAGTNQKGDELPELETFVNLKVGGTPLGTEVVWGPKGVIGVAPGTIQLSRSSNRRTLVFRKQGYKSRSLDVVPDTDKPLSVAMEPLASVTVTKDAGAEAIVNSSVKNAAKGKNKNSSGFTGKKKSGSAAKGGMLGKGSASKERDKTGNTSGKNAIENPF